jgi:general secretion pathway protein G
MQRLRGFTLIELLVVMAIIATLLTLALPRYFHSVDKSREAVLHQNLAETRNALDKFFGDNARYPDSLNELVEKKYLRSLPYDPVTDSSSAWMIVAPEGGESGAVFDLKSAAPGNGLDGTPYSEW